MNTAQQVKAAKAAANHAALVRSGVAQVGAVAQTAGIAVADKARVLRAYATSLARNLVGK